MKILAYPQKFKKGIKLKNFRYLKKYIAFYCDIRISAIWCKDCDALNWS